MNTENSNQNSTPQPPEQSSSLSDQAHQDRALFDRIAEQYCRKDLLPASRAARRQRLFQTLSAVPLPTTATVLEVGCGAGFSAEYLQARIGGYWGVDYSEKLIQYARARHTGSHIRFAAVPIQEFQPGQTFDLIFAIGLLHHLDDLDATLASLLPLLKPGGWFVANEPQPANPLISFARRIRKRIDANYSSDQKELTDRELRDACARHGLNSVRVLPQGFFSTPFAEVPLFPQWLTTPCSHLACLADRTLERLPGWLLQRLSWNLILAGQKPEYTDD